MKKAFQVLFFFNLLIIGCVGSENNKNNRAEKLQVSIDSLRSVISKNKKAGDKQISTFLTFQDGNGENAMDFYMSIFENSEVIKIQRWGKEGPGEEGKIMHAIFSLNGDRFMVSDSPPIHDWDFSPAVSNYIDCDTEEELDDLFSKLSEKGTITMPLNNYGFSRKFGWLIDQFGISWQLNLK